MTLTYRTTGAWGAGKGLNLTAAEIDGNTYDLDSRVTDLEENPPSPNEISNITQAGDTITIHMEDATTFGPFTLPRSVQRPTLTVAVTGTTLTPTASQASSYFRCSHVAGCEVTIPNNSAQAFLVDTELHFRQAGAGPVSFTPASGVTLNGIDGYLNETAGQGAVVTLKKVGTNEWDLFGFLAAETTA